MMASELEAIKQQGAKNPLVIKRHAMTHPYAAKNQLNSDGERPIRANHDKQSSRNGRPIQSNKSFGKKPFGNKSSPEDAPPRSGWQPQKNSSLTSRGTASTRDKKTFGSKPIFKKRPNFGDKPSPKVPGSNKPKKWHITATHYTKKRNSRKSNASPQGGQGTLKRRR